MSAESDRDTANALMNERRNVYAYRDGVCKALAVLGLAISKAQNAGQMELKELIRKASDILSAIREAEL